MDNKYENGKIYQIYSPSRPDLVYIGSTVHTLERRLKKHISSYKRYLEGKTNYTSSYKIFDVCEDYKIHLILNYPCDSRFELGQIENKYIGMYGTINKNMIDGIRHDKRLDFKLNRKKYMIKYIEKNKEELKKKKDIYWQKNKDILNKRYSVKIPCSCGSVISKRDLAKHKRTLKHQNFINNI